MSLISSVKLKERNHAMDVIRGFAVLGILLMNIPAFAIHDFFVLIKGTFYLFQKSTYTT